MFTARWLTVGLATVALLVPAVAPIASGHIRTPKTRSGYYWGGFTVKSAGSKKKVDPVNILLYPYAVRQADVQSRDRLSDRINTHLNAHYPGNWNTYDEITSTPRFCRGSQVLPFQHRAFSEEEQGVGFNTPNVSFNDCFNRVHTRLWSDDSAVNYDESRDEHDEPGTYFVGGVHYDELSSGNLFRGRGHYTGQDWDMVEWMLLDDMSRTSPHDEDHNDRSDRLGGHSVAYRWRPLIGSAGKFGADREGVPVESDGYMSRIDLRHCGADVCGFRR